MHAYRRVNFVGLDILSPLYLWIWFQYRESEASAVEYIIMSMSGVFIGKSPKHSNFACLYAYTDSRKSLTLLFPSSEDPLNAKAKY